MTAPDRTISVSGDAEVRVAPDQVQLTLGVVSFDKSLPRAKALHDDKVRRTLAALQRLGVEPKHMQTDFLNVEPRRDTVSYSKWSDTPDGYEVRRRLLVTLKDIKQFEDVISAVVEAGTNEIDGVEFQTTELRKHRDTARAMAIKAAREKASAMAAELGMAAGKAITISESTSSWGYSGGFGRRGGGMAQNAIQMVSSPPSEITDGFAPGQIAVRATVAVTFELS